MDLDDLKDTNCNKTLEAAMEHNRRIAEAWRNGRPACYGMPKVLNIEVMPRRSGYPAISPLEADLMDMMGDSLGG